MFKKIAIGALCAGVLLSGIYVNVGFNEAEADHEEKAGNPNSNEKVKNVIYMIPDGYNADYATSYRWFKGEESSFDPYVKGLMQTYSANSEVTDSAAAGTAMATGVKTNNGMVSVSPEKEEVDSILDAAEDSKKSTGLVATSTITHATPASFGASVEDRGDQAKIAPQYFENGVDVLLGGGRDYFLSTSEGGKQSEGNLIEEAQEDGYEYVTNTDELSKVKGEKVLGLFSDGPMASELERAETSQPSLADMTDSAIHTLDQDKDGFFLMVEGSQIDWAGHANDPAWAMHDSKAFDEAVAEAIDFAKDDGKTLVVVAGDHETGGMSVGANGEYDVKTEVLRDVTASGAYMAKQLNDQRSNVKEIVKEYTDLDLTNEEVNQIQDASAADSAINKVISDRALIGWTSGGHTGVDLPIYAYGPQSEKFEGLLENVDVPMIMAEAMKIELEN